MHGDTVLLVMAIGVICFGAIFGWFRHWVLLLLAVSACLIIAVWHVFPAADEAGFEGLARAIRFWLAIGAMIIFVIAYGLGWAARWLRSRRSQVKP